MLTIELLKYSENLLMTEIFFSLAACHLSVHSIRLANNEI